MLPFIHTCEKKLAPYFMKLPDLPHPFAKFLSQIIPVLVLIVGILGVLALWGMHNLVRSYYEYNIDGPQGGLFYWLAFVVTGIQAVALLMAVSPLMARKKLGWDILLGVALLVTASDIVQMFNTAQGSVLSQFFGTVIWNGVTFYILFQIRQFYAIQSKGKAQVKKS